MKLLLDVLDFLNWELPNLIILGLEKAISIILEGNFLRSYINLILLRWKTNQNWLLSGWCIKFTHIILINQDNTPFRIFIQISLHDPKCFHNGMSLIFKFTHKLSNNLSISLTSKGNVAKIFVLYLRMIIYDTIVDDKYFIILIIVWMTISLIYLSACCPSGMSNPNCWINRLFCELIDQSLNTI